VNNGGSAHDVIETRGRMSGASASAEMASWRELLPAQTRLLVPDELAPLPPDLFRLFHRLRMRYARLAGPALLARADDEGRDHVRLLKALLAEEAVGRDRATRELHRKQARLPSGKTFEAWDPAASAIPAEAQWALRSLDWLGRAENLVLVGPSGTGKSHFAEAICHAAIDVDLRVSWFTLESLTATISRSKVDASTSKVVARICFSELIVVDDIGLLPAGEGEAEALYRLIDAAYEKRSLILASNLHPGRFDTIFPKGLATAAVDRLLHHAHVVVTEGRSHRLSEALDGRGVQPLQESPSATDQNS
jgi:DNA replication protein DnaC